MAGLPPGLDLRLGTCNGRSCWRWSQLGRKSLEIIVTLPVCRLRGVSLIDWEKGALILLLFYLLRGMSLFPNL